MKLLALSAVCLALIAAVGCGGGSDPSDGSSGSSAAAESTGSTEASTTETSSPEKTESAPAKPLPTTDKTKPKVTVPKGISPNKFSIKELEKGTGPSAKKGDTVTIEYVVTGYDSKVEVDSSWDRKPYTFTLGSGAAVKGGERGIEGMKVGGRRELVIPGKLAYGPEGLAPTIGPNETLIFVVDLLAIE
jgi:peptidylprolyl isomerase